MEAKLLVDPRPQVDLRLQVVKPLMERNQRNLKDPKLLVDLKPQVDPRPQVAQRLLEVKLQVERNQGNLKQLVDPRPQVAQRLLVVKQLEEEEPLQMVLRLHQVMKAHQD